VRELINVRCGERSAAAGCSTRFMAAAAMVRSSLSVVGNAGRLRRFGA
jgi:cation transport ATPase